MSRMMLALGIVFIALGAGIFAVLKFTGPGEFLLLFTPLPQIIGILAIAAGAVGLGAWAVMRAERQDIETRDEINRQ